MKTSPGFRSRRLAVSVQGLAMVLTLFAQHAAAEDSPRLKWVESGMQEKTRGYRPMQISFAPVAPPELKKPPEGWKAPRYGSFKIGPGKAKATILVAIAEQDGKPTKLIVDGNANGDLTDDPAGEWEARKFTKADGGVVVSYTGSGTISIPLASGPQKARICFNMEGGAIADGKAAARAIYYSDFGYEGEVKIDGKSLAASLSDAGCTGDIRIAGDTWLNPLLWLDFDGDGKAGRNETIVVGRPFEFNGKWWKISDLQPDGSIQFAATEKPVATKPVGPDLSPGKTAPSFPAKLLGGKDVKFPDDYKGKVVLLDFWATWCGPCVAEIPNVVAAYGKFHGQGFEVLGISLDRENWEEKLAGFTKAKGMSWPQVYDGKFWSAEVAKTYGVRSIPRMLLVDGDTGAVIASENIRGQGLAPAIEKALADKKK